MTDVPPTPPATAPEDDLAALEKPAQDRQNVAAELATARTLADSITHAKAKAVIEEDLPAIQQRHDDAVKAHTDSGVTPAQIDAAAQRVIDARKPTDEPAA